MRVISGIAKGNKLIAPHGLATRPTLDRVRTSLFDIIGNKIENKKFADLFAGSGANGIEALSRGAEKAWFIDSSKKAIECIQKNLEKTRFTDKAIVIHGKIPEVLYKIAEPMDFVFIDPPYSYQHWHQLISSLIYNNIIAEHTQLIIEHCQNNIPTEHIEHLSLFRREKYGDTFLSFYS